MEGAPVTGDENANTSWVVEVENMLADGELSRSLVSARCEEQSIYRVPKWIKDMNSKAYQPQLVSLGPFHHGDSNLLPMEEHKRRALVQLVKRSGKPLQDFIAAVEEVADKLEAAYGNDLDDRWRGKNRHRFVEVMVTDGCFLLQILMGDLRGYEPHDPIFGAKSSLYPFPVILSDMLLMENQLPLLLLHRVLAVRSDKPLVDEIGEVINRLVLKFIGRSFPRDVINHLPLKLHPLDLYYTSLVYGPDKDRRSPLDYKHDTVPSAVKIHESGIKFRKGKTNSLNDIHFEHGVLTLPVVEVQDDTEYLFLNLMAFERLHVDVGTLVTDYVIFMDNIIDTVEDVALLSSEGVLKNFLGSDDEVSKLFNGTLSRGTVVGNSRKLHELQCDVKAYCWVVEGAPVTGDANANTSWVVEVENMLADRELSGSLESARCEEQSIYRVPKWTKDMNSKAYQPQLVSLGPFHHGDSNLLPMEEHKLRALVQLVKRSGKPLQDFIAAVEEVADKLEAAYGKDLDDRWRGENRHRFVEMMVTDGCFLLEILVGDLQDYGPRDPFFGTKGRSYRWADIRSDMLVMENQLPLLLLQRLVAVRFDIPLALVDQMGKDINDLVLKSMAASFQGDVINHLPLKLHPLDLYYTSLVYDYGADQDRRSQELEYKYDTVPSAVKIHESGIKFRKSKTNSFNDIHFEHGVLSMPVVEVQYDTEYLFLNLMAFERLHAACTLVTDYVCFMDDIIDSAEDVALLRSKGILKSSLGSNEEVATLFNGTLTRGAVVLVGNSNKLHELQWNVNAYCQKPWNKLRAHLIQIYFRNPWAHLVQTYFRNPWSFISMLAAVILLAATLLQTVLTVMQFKSKP